LNQQGLTIVYHALGKKADSDAALARWLKEDIDAYSLAEVRAFLGQSDEAMQWLERAYADKSSSLPYLKSDLLLKGLEADPRFKAFLKKMNLPE
jgi:hypothetical protein